MRANSVVILVVAIVLGGIAAFLARGFLLSRTQTSTSAVGTIVAAARQLPFGTPLADDNVIEIPWAAQTRPPGSFESKAALFKDGSRTTLANIEGSELILISKLTGPGQRASLSTMIDKDKRAVTIRVDDVRGVAGFILPNDHVDVMLIRTVAGSTISDVLLQDVKVIAIDQLAVEGKERAVVVRAVTLEVTPIEAQKISLATNVGQLSLTLRKAGDARVLESSRVQQSDLFEARRESSAKPAAVAEASPSYADVTVGIMRNLVTQEYKVRTVR